MTITRHEILDALAVAQGQITSPRRSDTRTRGMRDWIVEQAADPERPLGPMKDLARRSSRMAAEVRYREEVLVRASAILFRDTPVPAGVVQVIVQTHDLAKPSGADIEDREWDFLRAMWQLVEATSEERARETQAPSRPRRR